MHGGLVGARKLHTRRSALSSATQTCFARGSAWGCPYAADRSGSPMVPTLGAAIHMIGWRRARSLPNYFDIAARRVGSNRPNLAI
eukprot:3825324-Pleurochrysis_carterae.AAC.1